MSDAFEGAYRHRIGEDNYIMGIDHAEPGSDVTAIALVVDSPGKPPVLKFTLTGDQAQEVFHYIRHVEGLRALAEEREETTRQALATLQNIIGMLKVMLATYVQRAVENKLKHSGTKSTLVDAVDMVLLDLIEARREIQRLKESK
jgi:CRISPR/Cas system CSM-associated protein Csm2 small subunit